MLSRPSLVFDSLLTTWLLCASGRAQDVERADPHETERSKAASLGEAPALTEAHEAVDRAEQLFHVGNYEAALVDFAHAYQLLQHHPRQYVVLNNMAVCYERLFRYDEALHFYERYLEEGGTNAADHAAVRAALETLRNLLSTVRVEANVRAEVWVDDRRMSDVPATLSVPAGRHLIEVRALLHESARRELTLEARSSYRLRLELASLSNYRGIAPAYFIGSAILAGALLVTGGVLAANTLHARGSGLDDAERGMQLRTAELEREQTRIRRWALGTDLAFGAGALFGVTTLLLYFLTDWHGEHTLAPATSFTLLAPGGEKVAASTDD